MRQRDTVRAQSAKSVQGKSAKAKSVLGLAVLAMAVLATGVLSAEARQRSRIAASPRIACGITGCFEVKPGCYVEMRYSGRGGGQVAVVICGRR